QGLADLQQRLLAVGQLHDEQVALGVHQPGPLQDLDGPLGVAEHEAEDGTVGRVDDGQRHDPDVRGFEAAEDVDERPDAVGQEQVDLADARPTPPGGGGEVRPGAFPAAHADALAWIRDYTTGVCAGSTALAGRPVDARRGGGHDAAADIVS